MLREVTVSLFREPFEFIEEKFYLSENSNGDQRYIQVKGHTKKTNTFRESKSTQAEINKKGR